jgi:hypothetical protein
MHGAIKDDYAHIAYRVTSYRAFGTRFDDSFLNGPEEAAHINHTANDAIYEVNLSPPSSMLGMLTTDLDIIRGDEISIKWLNQHFDIGKLTGSTGLFLVTIFGSCSSLYGF